MSRCSIFLTCCVLSILAGGIAASAETLRCQSINGNLNCAGSGGVSCQTVNGKKVCVSGHGDVVQSFGNGSPDDGAANDDEGLDNTQPDPAPRQHLEMRNPSGRTLLLDRDGSNLHLRTDWLSVDRN